MTTRITHSVAVAAVIAAAAAIPGVPGAGAAGAPVDGNADSRTRQVADPAPPAGPAPSPGPDQAGRGAAGRYADVNGLRLYYEVHGAGTPLVLLHGGLATIEGSFENVLPALAKTRRIIAIEQQAHGHTADIDRPLTYEQMADDTDALLEQLHIPTADFFGWSDGADVALQIAIRHPARVGRLVLLGAHIDNEDALDPEILAWLKDATPDDFGPEVKALYAKAAPDPGQWPALVAKWKALQLEFKGIPPAVIQAIDVPVLVMAGDGGGDRPEHAVKLFRLFPSGNAQLAVLPGTSHFAIMEHPDWILSMVTAFLDKPLPAPDSQAREIPAEKISGKVTSKDGTSIAFDRSGRGPVLILVAGALSDRSSSARLAALLAPHFTVINYDRRGRGDSGDTQPYALQREVEDIEALIDKAGGSAFLFGSSSGAVLALEATSKLPGKIRKQVLFEPPFVVDDSRPPVPADFAARVTELVAADRRGDAVEYFMTDAVGVPAEYVAQMKLSPMWKTLQRTAHTLAYDGAVMGGTQAGKPLPRLRWVTATAPTLVMDGGQSDAWLRHSSQALADILPNAKHRTLEGVDHSAAFTAPQALVPVLVEFFAER